MKAPFLIGRILLGGFFLKSGIDNLRKRQMITGYVGSKGVPKPELAVALSAVPLIVGGASLISGVKPKIGTLAVLGFLASVSPVMHDFWKNEDPKERESNKIDFAKNVALAGAALALMGVEEPWEASVPVGHPSFKEKVIRMGRRLA